MGYDILFKCVTGYTDLPGNDLADKLAKNAAKCAQQNTTTSSLSLTEAKNIIKCKAAYRWKTCIESTTKDHHHLPRPSTKTFKSSMSRTAESRLHRLMLNHTLIRIHRNKMFPKQYSTPAYDCGAEIQSIEHFLFNCPLIKDQRSNCFTYGLN